MTCTLAITNCTFGAAAEYSVSGGRLELVKTAIDKKSTLRLSGTGVISVADGEIQRFAEVYVDGEQVYPGIYSYATAPAALKAHMAETTGQISVTGGFVLIFR